MLGVVGSDTEVQSSLDAMLQHIITSSAIEGEQLKVLNRLLDGGERGFENGISAAQYQAVAKVSKLPPRAI